MAAAKNLELKLTITADGKVAVQQLGAVDAAMDGVGASAKQASADAGSLKGALASLGAAALAREFVQANAALESNALALEAVLGSQEAAADAMAYIASLADRLGISIADATAQFVSLSAATRGTALEGQQTREVFESVVNAMAKLGRSSAQTQQALVAVSQMAAKGTVSMEELRGQLGEALPGAIQAMASAMGVTVQELGAMIASGDVLAQDALPALARGLDATFGADKAGRVDSLTASVNRLQNAISKSFTETGQNGLAEVFQKVIDFGTYSMTGITQGFVSLGQNLGALGAYATGAIPSFDELAQTMVENNEAAQARLDALTAQGAAEQSAGASAEAAGTAIQGATAKVEKGAKSLRSHASASDAAKKGTDELKAAQDGLNKALADQAAEKAGASWQQASALASQAASQLSSGKAEDATKTLAAAFEMLERAVAKGDTSAGIAVMKRELDALAKAAEAAKKAVSGATGTDASTKDAKTDTGTGATAGAAKTVADQFSKPITLTFDVTAAAQAAATTVADAIATAVTTRLAGLALSVPVTAIVTVDAGGANVTSDLATEAAKRGSKQ